MVMVAHKIENINKHRHFFHGRIPGNLIFLVCMYCILYLELICVAMVVVFPKGPFHKRHDNLSSNIFWYYKYPTFLPSVEKYSNLGVSCWQFRIYIQLYERRFCLHLLVSVPHSISLYVLILLYSRYRDNVTLQTLLPVRPAAPIFRVNE